MGDVTFLFFAHRLMVVYICTKFRKNIFDVFKITEVTIFIPKLSKRHYSAKSVGGVTVLVLCSSSDCGLYMYQVF